MHSKLNRRPHLHISSEVSTRRDHGPHTRGTDPRKERLNDQAQHPIERHLQDSRLRKRLENRSDARSENQSNSHPLQRVEGADSSRDNGEPGAGMGCLPTNIAAVSAQDIGQEPGYLPLSRTTDRVLQILLEGDLARLRAESVAEHLGISCTTLRRRLRNDHTSYQFLLDRARQYRCESRLRERWLPGKCFADELGYLEVNSFYRAFRRWTGLSYSEYKETYH